MDVKDPDGEHNHFLRQRVAIPGDDWCCVLILSPFLGKTKLSKCKDVVNLSFGLFYAASYVIVGQIEVFESFKFLLARSALCWQVRWKCFITIVEKMTIECTARWYVLLICCSSFVVVIRLFEKRRYRCMRILCNIDLCSILNSSNFIVIPFFVGYHFCLSSALIHCRRCSYVLP